MRQPSGSKIKIASTDDRLEIIIPARFRPDKAAKHQLGLAGTIDSIAVGLLIITIYISLQFSGAAGDLAVKVGLGVALMFLVPLTLWLLKGGFKLSFELADKFLSHTKIEIDRRQFTLSQHLYTLERSRPKHLKTYEITQTIVDTYQHPDLKVKKVALMLELRQNDPIRVLSTGQDLTVSEIKWLAVKLSNWLGVDLFSEDLDLGDRS
jgi:hypothetical protein